MCGAVGDDFMGEDYLAQLQVENVNTNYMSKNNMQSTGIANINVETSTGSNTIVIIPGKTLIGIITMLFSLLMLLPPLSTLHHCHYYY